MSYSRHKLSPGAPLCEIRVKTGRELLVSEESIREKLQESYHRGFEAGQRSLGEQLVEQRKQLLDLQNGVLLSIERALPGLVAECEKSLVLLALEGARQVLQQVPIDAAVVERVVKRALSELQDTAEYEVLLHPDDVAELQKVQSGLLPAPDNRRVRFNSDLRVNRGDCVINTRHGSIAAIREHMLDKLESAVVC